jgi:acetyltransferase-like isoleucine patch superfamily enzyme
MYRLFHALLKKILKKYYYSLIFKKYSSDSKIINPLMIEGAENISIGKNVTIQYNTRIAAMPHTGAELCQLIIGDGAYIGCFNHIYATKSIIIESNVLIADRVYISDNIHDYSNPLVPVKDQGVIQKKEVVIGSGCWIGENVSIIGASVGKNSVVGANSVVLEDIPDYCVVAGIPARILKKYNFETLRWEKYR